MPTVADVCAVLDRLAPPSWAFDFDEVGLHVGDRSAAVRKVLVALDHSGELIQQALANRVEMVVTHHPLIFRPIGRLEPIGHVNRIATELIRNGIALACAHTNWDCANGGVNDALASRLGLERIRPVGEAATAPTWKVTVFCPAESVEPIVDSASAVGAGQIGAYERCAFLAEGTGTYRGGEGTNPAIGASGQIEHVEEVRVEMVVPERLRASVEAAIRATHSYEEPAIDWFRLRDAAEQRIGRIGELRNPVSLQAFVTEVNSKLDTSSLAWGDPDRLIERVAVCGGAADDFHDLIGEADVLVTGEVKQHNALEGVEAGIAMVAAGHYATEQPGVEALAEALAKELPAIHVEVFEPEPGTAGRPWW